MNPGSGMGSDGMGAMMGSSLLPLLFSLLVVVFIVVVILSALLFARLRNRSEPGVLLTVLPRRSVGGEVGSGELERNPGVVLRSDSEAEKSIGLGISMPTRQLGLIAAGLSLAAGLIHLVAAPEHLHEWWGYGYFFLASGIGQV